MNARTVHALALWAALAGVYYAAAKLGLLLAVGPGVVTPVWPPSGIALAALLQFGWRAWPGIALGSILVSLSTSQSAFLIVSLTLGNILEAAVAAYLLRRLVNFRPALERLEDVLGLVILGALFSTTISATIGILSLCLSDVFRWADALDLWWTWWLGNAIGDLIVAPVLLVWTNRPRLALTWRQVAETAAGITTLALASVVVFCRTFTPSDVLHPLTYVIFPLVMGAAIRLGPHGAATTTLIASIIAIFGTVSHLGPFGPDPYPWNMIQLQVYMGVTGITAMAVAAAVTERRRTAESLFISEQEFRQVWEQSVDGMRLLDATGITLRVNEAFCRIVDKSAAELCGQLFTVIYPEAARETILARFRTAALHGEVPPYFEREIVLWNGQKRWVEHSNSLLAVPGRPPLVLSIFRDISERKQAEERLRLSEERYRKLFDDSPQPMYVFDWDNYHFLAVNEAALFHYGYTRAEFMALTLLDIRPPESIPELLAHLHQGPPSIGKAGVRKHRKKDGTVFDAAISAHDIFFEGRRARFVLVEDITERLQAEEALRQSQQKYETLVNTLDGIVWEGDPQTLQFTFVSLQAEAILGYPVSAWLTEPDFWVRHIHPDDRDWATNFCQQMTIEGKNHQFEYRMIAADGRTVWLRDVVAVVVENNRPIKARGLMMDITERRKADEQLRESEERYRTLVEHAPEAVVVLDADTDRFVEANENAVHLFGFPREALLKIGLVEVSPPRQADGRPSSEAAQDHIRRALLGEAPVLEWLHRNAKGKDVVCEMRLVRLPAGGRKLVRGSIADITARKQAEAMLRYRLELEKLIAQISTHFINLALEEIDSGVQSALQHIGEFAGADRSYIFLFRENGKLMDNTHEWCAPDIDPQLQNLKGIEVDTELPWFARRIKCGEVIHVPKVSSLPREANQEKKHFQMQDVRSLICVPILHRGMPVGFLGFGAVRLEKSWPEEIVGLLTIVGDIFFNALERQRAEHALRQSEAKYRTLLENLEQHIFLKDSELCYVAANKPFCLSVNRTEADIVGRTDFDLYPRRLAEKYRTDDYLVLDQGKRQEIEEQTLIEGSPRIARVVKTPVKDDQGKIVGVLGIRWDVTEQRNLEAQLRQVQKMEAIGQLAGGVAHDFNNLMTAILGNLALVLTGPQLSAADRDMLRAAENAGQRAAELTRQLLGFSRRTVLHPQSLNLNIVMGETVAILRRTIDPRILLEMETEPQLWPVRADPGQMNQVLMNLCLNARDAMPNGGRLLLQTANFVVDAAMAQQHVDARPGDMVRLRVSDTGQGIAPDQRAHIFEPFFTTKEPGKGTGLGLAMVFGIVKQHQGWIDCYSEINRGTRFDIFLPRCQEEVAELPAPAEPRTTTKGTETILLVDDEAMIRNLGREILRRHGYQVLLAENGRWGVDLYRREGQHIDLVILDLTMPELSGRDTLRILRQLNPQVRVLFSSGYSGESLTETEQDGVLGFISKPYSPKTLAETVRAALDRPVDAAATIASNAIAQPSSKSASPAGNPVS